MHNIAIVEFSSLTIMSGQLAGLTVMSDRFVLNDVNITSDTVNPLEGLITTC